MATLQMKESELLRLVLDWLAAREIYALRMNTGAVKTENRFFRFGVPGMADILAFPHESGPRPLWIELKAGTNGQSELQKSFQKQVEREGHTYILCRSLEELEAHFL